MQTLRAALVPVLAEALDGYTGPTRAILGETFPKPFTEAVQEILVGAVPVRHPHRSAGWHRAGGEAAPKAAPTAKQTF